MLEVGCSPGTSSPRFNLLPWRWTHWALLFIGPLFVIFYLTLLAWAPVDEAIQRLAASAGSRDARDLPLARAEAIFGVITSVLLTPLAAIVTLFLLLFALVALTIVLGPFVRVLGLPDWVVVLLLGLASRRCSIRRAKTGSRGPCGSWTASPPSPSSCF